MQEFGFKVNVVLGVADPTLIVFQHGPQEGLILVDALKCATETARQEITLHPANHLRQFANDESLYI